MFETHANWESDFERPPQVFLHPAVPCHRDISRPCVFDITFVPSGIELNYHNLLAHEAYGI